MHGTAGRRGGGRRHGGTRGLGAAALLAAAMLAAAASSPFPASAATPAAPASAPARVGSAASAAVSVTEPPPSAAAQAADALVAEADKLYATGANAAALVRYESARQQLAAAGEARTLRYARLLTGLAQLHRGQRDMVAAEAWALEAETLLQALGQAQSTEMADLLNVRTMLAYGRQDLPETLRLARAEVALLHTLGQGETVEVLDAYATQGAVLSQQYRLDEADQALNAGLRLAETLPDVPVGAHMGLLHNLAANANDRGDPAAALALAGRALALATRSFGENSARHVVGLLLVARAHDHAGRLGESLRTFERALRIVQAQPDKVDIVRRLRLQESMARLLVRLGDGEAARARLQAGIADAAGDNERAFWRGRYLRQLGLLSLREARPAQADDELGQAVQLIAASLGEANPTVLDIQADRCLAQLRARREAGACMLLRGQQAALAVAAPAFRYRAHAALAEQAQAEGRTDEALDELLRALGAAQRSGSAEPLWLANDALAQHLRGRRREPALAVFFGKQAIAAIEALRGEIVRQTGNQLERLFIADKAASYRRLAGWLAEDGRIDEALQTLRLLKEEEFYDFLQRDGGLVDGQRRSELSPAELRLRQRWRQLEGREAETGWTEQARETLAALAREVRGSPAALPPAARTLPPPHRPGGEPTLVVHALAGEDQLTLVFDSPARREILQQPLDAAALGRDIGDLLALLTDGDASRTLRAAAGASAGWPTDTPAQRRLQALVGQPIARAAQAAGAKRVVLHLDGVLRYLPLAALHDGQRYLGERFALSHRVEMPGRGGPGPAPAGAAGASGRAGASDSDDSGTARAVPPAAARLQALGVTRAWNGLRPLEGVAQEVCGIVDGPVWGLDGGACSADGERRGRWTGEAWLDAQFTARRLTEATERGRRDRQPALLHVGTHFTLRPGNVARSWMLLGDGSRLHLDEIAQLDFAGHALVTLSACETGIGGAPGADGREIDGLNMLVVRRGAQAVLASLWRVDDASTSALMRHFYRELQRHAPAEALRRAQQAVRLTPGGRWAAPRHWAGFYVTER